MGEAEDPETYDIKNIDTDDFNPFLLYAYSVYDLLRRYRKALYFQQLNALAAGVKRRFLFGLTQILEME